MINNRTIVEFQDQAFKWWGRILESGKITTGTKNCTLQVTENCNLACTYCYQICKSSHRMPFDIAKKYIDVLLTDKDIEENYESIILDFIGGEPLLEIDLIDKVVDYFKYKAVMLSSKFAYRFRISICTNGILYFNPKVQKFIKKNAKDLSFSVSLDGNKKLHDACRVFPDGSPSYELVVKAINHYKNTYGQLPGTKMTLSPENIDYTFDALLNMINLGYTNVFANCIYEAEWSNNHATTLYNQLKLLTDYIYDNDLEEYLFISLFDNNMFTPMSIKDDSNWCGGNGEMLAVDHNGTIYPCLRYMKSSLGDSVEPITCGDISNGIDHKVLEVMQKVTRTSQSTEECINCPIATGCSWCTAYNYQSTGSINKRVTNICIMHKARSLANAYYWNKMYRKHNMTDRFTIHLPDNECLRIIDQSELDMLKYLSRKD